MRNESNMDNSWSDHYLDTIEALYGEFDLHPALTIQELGDEWKECFREDGQVRVDLEKSQLVTEWSRSYLDALETIYGKFDLHPASAIQKLLEKWQPQFIASSDKQRIAYQNNSNISSMTA